jgi:hypothetical protein
MTRYQIWVQDESKVKTNKEWSILHDKIAKIRREELFPLLRDYKDHKAIKRVENKMNRLIEKLHKIESPDDGFRLIAAGNGDGGPDQIVGDILKDIDLSKLDNESIMEWRLRLRQLFIDNIILAFEGTPYVDVTKRIPSVYIGKATLEEVDEFTSNWNHEPCNEPDIYDSNYNFKYLVSQKGRVCYVDCWEPKGWEYFK